MWVGAEMLLTLQQRVSSTPNKKLKCLIDASKCIGIKILTSVMKQKNKIWIGRTKLPL
jgi:hypothetical protein